MFSIAPRPRLGTRLAFLIAGFGTACWAPLVPYAKARLSIGPDELGLLLLCLGLGSLFAMLLVGPVCARVGARPVILSGAVGMVAVLPALAIAGSALGLGMALALFGASLGAIDAAMNIHAAEVEQAENRPLMSGFHALYSLGGFAGSAMMSLLLARVGHPFTATVVGAALMAIALVVAWPNFLRTRVPDDQPHFALPRGTVLALSLLAAITFLAEGALLDWSALLITERGLVDVSQGGTGYMFFAIAMTVGRLSGDALIARLGERRMLFWGGLIAVAGFAMLLLANAAAPAMRGSILIGLGAANIVPVLFSLAGRQKRMPPALAIAALTTTGYAGVLCGPAAIGAIAAFTGLSNAFWMLAALLLLVPICARLVTRGT